MRPASAGVTSNGTSDNPKAKIKGSLRASRPAVRIRMTLLQYPNAIDGDHGNPSGVALILL